MKKQNDFFNLGEGFSPEHDQLVFEAEAYFKKQFNVSKVSYEVPLIARNNFIVGYVDLLIETTYKSKIDKCNYAGCSLVVEVKPTIGSFGALLRQLNTYKLHLNRINKPEICVYSNDTRFSAQLESQGYIQYFKGKKLPKKKA